MRIIVVDDEPLARARLAALVAEIGAGEIVAEAGDGREALVAYAASGADVLLLDIRMPGMDGLEAARHLARLEHPPAIVFTTAYDDHALAAFEAHAIGYLVKPVRRERLAAALERAATLSRGQAVAVAAVESAERGARTHVSATLSGRLQLVPVDEVRYFRAEHKYVVARHPAGELVLDDSLSALEGEFGDRFLRVHRNALVAAAWVRRIEREADGRWRVHLDGIDESLEVSRRLVSSVKRALIAH